jgi:Tol biopolymer transport system component
MLPVHSLGLLTLTIGAGLLAVQCANRPATHADAVKAPQLCVPRATHASTQFALVHGYITYTYASEIWAADPNHPANRISLRPSHGLAPVAWSRDGSRLLLMERRDAGATGPRRDLCEMNADGSGIQLTSDGLSSGDGSFSPDGTEVVFSRMADHGLYVVDAKGGVPRLIAKSSGYVGSPTWSPDGSRIAYTVYMEFGPNGSTFEIWTVNPDGTDPRQLVDLGRCGGGGCSGGLVWSPDGSTLAFQTRRDIPLGTPVLGDNQSIYLVQADGSGLHRISDDGFQPSWSPDGSRIAFLRSAGFAEVRLYTMARDGSDVRLVEGVFAQPSSLAWDPVR